jgi:hypothetical protein
MIVGSFVGLAEVNIAHTSWPRIAAGPPPRDLVRR